MKEIGIVFLLLVAGAVSAGAIIPDTCPIPQQEACPPYSSDPAGAQRCQARNSNENARYWQCEQELQRARQREREEEQRRQQQEDHDKYCRQYPNANGCK
jgi:hypothetical protein